MNAEEKRAALAAYKEQKVSAGIYAVRCAPAGAMWVGGAPNLGTIWNRLCFQLRMKGCPHRSMQAAWDAHGPDSFTFEVLERLEEEEIAYARAAALKARAAHWGAELNAPVI